MGATGLASGSTKSSYLQAVRWLRGGWALLQRSPSLWFGMSGIYLVLAVLLEGIPFAGHLLLILLTPLLLAGALYALPDGGVSGNRSAADRYLRAPARQLLQAFAVESRVYPAVLMAIVTVGLVVLIAIGQYFIGAGSVSAEWAAARHGVTQTASIVVRLLVTTALFVVLFMALFYALPRTVYAHRDPLSAISDSFSACKRHALPLLWLALVFFAPYLAIAAAFRGSIWLGLLLLFTLGLVSLPLLVLAAYCSYRDAFPDTRRANQSAL